MKEDFLTKVFNYAYRLLLPVLYLSMHETPQQDFVNAQIFFRNDKTPLGY